MSNNRAIKTFERCCTIHFTFVYLCVSSLRTSMITCMCSCYLSIIHEELLKKTDSFLIISVGILLMLSFA